MQRRRNGSKQFDLLLTNCRVATMSESQKDKPYGMLAGGAPDSAVAVKDGRLAFVGLQSELQGSLNELAHEIYDTQGQLVTPGLIDCHTHIVYGGDRCDEWETKLKGASYEEVAEAGGGIVNTVDKTRKLSPDELLEMSKPRVEALLNEGVTSIDIKSGFGLNLENERKTLQVGRKIGEKYNITVLTTYLGAHALPREYKGRQDEYIDTVVSDLEVLSKEGLVDAVDAFCETIGFTEAQTAKVFEKAQELGIPRRLHGDALHDGGGGALAAKFRCLSCDHCEYTSLESVKAMAASGTVAVFLPSANYFSQWKKRPPVEAFRKNGVPMALGTNCNPGSSPCCSMLLNLNMACTLMGLTPEEALLGATRNAAKAMGISDDRGSLDVGKAADLAVWDVKKPCELVYMLGLNRLTRCYREGTLQPKRG